jgi:hypothetical protein
MKIAPPLDCAHEFKNEELKILMIVGFVIDRIPPFSVVLRSVKIDEFMYISHC